MNAIRETVFDLLFNAFLQIGFFTLVTAALSRLIAKAKQSIRTSSYIAALIICVSAPAVNTLWQSHQITPGEASLQPAQTHSAGTNHFFWNWQEYSGKHSLFTPRPVVQNWIVSLWGLFVLYQLIQFGRGMHRVHRLRRSASVLAPDLLRMTNQTIAPGYRVALFQSADIDDPVTVGLFHPAIMLPSKVLPELSEQDLATILAHEYGHIRRRDFLTHIVCELISLPMAWHPGIQYLMSKISQTRELACDEYAAFRLGKPQLYARTLLRLASLCLHTPRRNAIALGIFDGDNLEVRIMMLTEKKRSLSRAGVIGLTLAMIIPFTVGAVLAHSMSLQATAPSSNTAQSFAGTWHWMFDGKSFATMILVRDGAGYSGTVTGSRIALKKDGRLLKADPTEDARPNPISSAELQGSVLRVTVKDGGEKFEFNVTLKDDTHAEIHPQGAPPNMEPIPAEKVH